MYNFFRVNVFTRLIVRCSTVLVYSAVTCESIVPPAIVQTLHLQREEPTRKTIASKIPLSNFVPWRTNDWFALWNARIFRPNGSSTGRRQLGRPSQASAPSLTRGGYTLAPSTKIPTLISTSTQPKSGTRKGQSPQLAVYYESTVLITIAQCVARRWGPLEDHPRRGDLTFT